MSKTLNLVQKWKLARKVEPFTLKKGIMHGMGQNNKMRKCLTTSELQIILKEWLDDILEDIITNETFYEMGFIFYRSNQTSKKINKKKKHFGSYKLCNQVGRQRHLEPIL